MRFSLMIFALCFSLILSCKKDKLKGDKSIFIGKWKWVQTKILNNSCGGGPEYYTYKDPTSEGINYSIEFLRCGKVVYYEDSKETSKDRIVFDRYEEANQVNWLGYLFYFGIDGDNKNEKHIGGVIKNDTLIIIGYGWPNYYRCDCCKVRAYFIRE